MKKDIKLLHKLGAIIISILAILFLYSQVNVSKVKSAFANSDLTSFVYIIVTFILMYLLEALRWKIIVSTETHISYKKSFAMIAFAGFFNVILPMKTSSFTKAYFLKNDARGTLSHGISMVIYEKFSDLSMMSAYFIVIMLIGRTYNYLTGISMVGASIFVLIFMFMHSKKAMKFLPLGPLVKFKVVGEALNFLQNNFSHDGFRKAKFLFAINFLTGMVWLLYIIQTLLFFTALRLSVPTVITITNMLAATYVGILPVSISGIGTRDMAIVYLFKGYLSYDQAISIGIMSTMRLCVPVLLGVPFLFNYLLSRKAR